MRAIPRALTTDAIQEVLQTGAALTISEIITELNRQGLELPVNHRTYQRISDKLDQLTSVRVIKTPEVVASMQVQVRRVKRYALPVEA